MINVKIISDAIQRISDKRLVLAHADAIFFIDYSVTDVNLNKTKLNVLSERQAFLIIILAS